MKRKFAAFDIDGTLFRSHLFWEVVLELARQDSLHPQINKKTLELYDNYKRRSEVKAFEIFDKEVITAIKELIQEIDPTKYDEIVEKYLTEKLDHVYVYTKKLIKELKDQGYFLLAISGSRKEEVNIFAPYHGFDDWIGQDFERTPDGKKYTGVIKSTFDNKDKTLKAFVEKHNLTFKDSYAVGDTGSDISLLKLVDNPIAFNPNEDLLNEARKQGWKIVVERKSIAFELESKNGSYILANTKI